jgi:hypothetical protein
VPKVSSFGLPCSSDNTVSLAVQTGRIDYYRARKGAFWQPYVLAS